MVYSIDLMFERFRKERGAIQIVRELPAKALLGISYENNKLTAGRYSRMLVTIRDNHNLEDQVLSVIHEWLHLEQPFVQYLPKVPESIEWLIESTSEELYHQDPEGVFLIRQLLDEAHKVKPEKYFV